MIITRTPYRVSLFGGGTDYNGYFEQSETGGAVLGFALNKYCYLVVRSLPPYFDHKYRVVYSRVELTKELYQIEHPAVRGVLGWFRDYSVCPYSIEVTYAGDLPAGSGIGSSSSFTVGLINAIASLYGLTVSPKILSDRAIQIEQSFEVVGCQDQVFAAYGGFLHIKFTKDDIQVQGFGKVYYEALLENLLLFYTGESRNASSIAAKYDLKSKYLDQIKMLVKDAYDAVFRGNIENIGPLLDQSWQYKKALAEGITTTLADDVYREVMQAGATGCKLLGAGGGGCMLIFSHPRNHANIRHRLHKLVEIPVGVSQTGSTVIAGEKEIEGRLPD